jgi:hypothetical protein
MIPQNGTLEIFFIVSKVPRQGSKKPYELDDFVKKIQKGKYNFGITIPIYKDNTSYFVTLSPYIGIDFY